MNDELRYLIYTVRTSPLHQPHMSRLAAALVEAIAEDREKAYREGLKDGYETAKGIYDHTGRAA